VQTDSELAVTRFGSGGGFSNIYPVPSYQSKAVNGYLSNHQPPTTNHLTPHTLPLMIRELGPGAVSTTEMVEDFLMSALWEIIL
jgi:hypothetical protein